MRKWLVSGLVFCLGAWTGACGKKTSSDQNPSVTCEALTGTSWTPNVSGVSSSNHDSNVSVMSATHTGSALLTGYAQGYDSSHVITVSGIDMGTDLGSSGSLSLIAEPTNFPSSLQGSAWPVLVSLSDGVNELVNVSGCTSSGFYTTGGSAVSGCGPDPDETGGSAYLGTTAALRRSHWEQFQRLKTSDYLSVNTFPTCNWSGTTPKCSFAETPGNFFVSGKLRAGTGVTYTAKYVLLATSYSSAGNSYSAGVKLTVIRKKDTSSGSGTTNAVDLNVILVGNKVINQSRTDKGKQNLDALFTHVYNHLYTQNSASSVIKLGTINVLEWECANGGDAYATVDVTEAGEMFKAGSALVSSSTETKALNLFLVSSIDYSGSGTVLGLSGGITGAMINGTTSSGLVFSSLNKLDTYNPNCTPGSACPITSQETGFMDMGGTVSHEIGHFLGLNHPSEREGSTHDRVPDTPNCTNKSGSYITISSCRADTNVIPGGTDSCNSVCSSSQYSNTPYCSDKTECQFNHVMWWTSKSYNTSGQGDGNIFSTQSGKIINYSPYVQ